MDNRKVGNLDHESAPSGGGRNWDGMEDEYISRSIMK